MLKNPPNLVKMQIDCEFKLLNTLPYRLALIQLAWDVETQRKYSKQGRLAVYSLLKQQEAKIIIKNAHFKIK